MVRREALVFEMNARGGDRLDLIVTDAKPGRPCAHQKTVQADGINEWDQGGIAQHANIAAFQVIDLNAQQLREIKDLVFRNALLEHNGAQFHTRRMTFRQRNKPLNILN